MILLLSDIHCKTKFKNLLSEDINQFVDIYVNLKNEKSKILLTHFPPKNIFLNSSYGSKTVEEIYNTLKPSLTICGHNHDDGGKIDKKNAIINPGGLGIVIEDMFDEII